MPEVIGAAAALVAGAALGLGFFGSLWWTVQRVASFSHPGLAVLTSLLLRSGLTLAGFFAVAGVQWQRWLLCLLGFTLARWVLGRWLRGRVLRPAVAGGRHAA